MCDYNSIFKEIAEYKRIEEEAKRERETRENIIKEFMQAGGLEALTGTEHKALYKAVTSSRFDTKAFKADHADIAAEYMKTSTSMRFTFA